MRRARLTPFALVAAAAVAGSCSLNPQPLPPSGDFQTSNPGNAGGSGNDASVSAADAGLDTSSEAQTSPIVRGEGGESADATSDMRHEGAAAEDSPFDGTMEAGE